MKNLFLCICLLASMSAISQPKFVDYEIELGPFFKVSKRSVPVQFIGNDASGFYMAYAQGKIGLGEVSLKKFGYNLQLDKELRLSQEIDGEIAYASVVFMLDGELYQFTRSTSFSSKKIYLQHIDKKGWKLDEPQFVTTIEEEGRSAYNAKMAVHFSRDSSHIALAYTLPNKRNENEEFGIHVFDKSMKEVWNGRFELPYTNKLLDLTTHRIAPSGDLYILGKRFYERRRETLAGEINYDYLLFSFQKEGEIDSFKIESEGKYLKDMQIDISPNGDIVSAGFYSDLNSAMAGGAYYMRIDGSSKKIASTSFKEFDRDFLLQNMTEGKAKRTEKKLDKGKDVELPFYYIDEFLLDKTEKTKIIAERRYIYLTYVYSPYGSVSMTNYEYGDMMVIDIDEKGQITAASRIAKYQHTVNDAAAYSSYSSARNDDYVYLIFNDNASNVDYNGVGRVAPMVKGSTTMVMIARIDETGKVERDALFDRGDIETKVRPALCTQLNENEMLLFGHKGLKTQRFILLKFE